HGTRHIDGITWMPCSEQFPCILLHDRGIAFNLFLMEGRLYRVTLLAMLCAIDTEQAFTGETAIVIILGRVAIREIARVFHQDVAHMFRAEQHDSRILS